MSAPEDSIEKLQKENKLLVEAGLKNYLAGLDNEKQWKRRLELAEKFIAKAWWEDYQKEKAELK